MDLALLNPAENFNLRSAREYKSNESMNEIFFQVLGEMR